MADDVKIVMFCCNWCSYGGADTAGTARMQYPPNIRVIRVMCSGRIDPQFVLKAFKEGADVYIINTCTVTVPSTLDTWVTATMMLEIIS